jgi:type IV fimbrial biogenesis protein FimT
MREMLRSGRLRSGVLRSNVRYVLGFTLIELLIVIAMLAILASLAAPSFNALRLNQKLASTASDIFASTLQARNEALRLNRRVTIAPLTGGDWKTGWHVYVDMNNNDAYDSPGDTVVVTGSPIYDGFTVTNATGAAPPTAFTFDSRGFLRGSAAGTIVVKSAETTREKRVIVYATGRARLCDPKLVTNCTNAN